MTEETIADSAQAEPETLEDLLARVGRVERLCVQIVTLLTAQARTITEVQGHLTRWAPILEQLATRKPGMLGLLAPRRTGAGE